MRRPLSLVVLALTVVAATVACTGRDVASSQCLDGDRPVYVVPGSPTTPWPSTQVSLPNGTTIDARGRTFDSTYTNAGGWATGIKIHNQAGTRSDLCIVGGEVLSETDAHDTSFGVWHDSAGIRGETADLHIVGTKFFNVGDMIQFAAAATDWRVTGVSTDGGGSFPGGYIHDDCIENDAMNSGVLEDSKLDGCHVFMSSFAANQDGRGNQVVVSNTLVRLQPMYNSFDPAKYGHDQHGGFFKWSTEGTYGYAPKLVIHSSTFRADQQAYYGGNSSGWLGLPPGTECGDVTLVGTAAWRPGDVASWVNQCDSVTFGSDADWNAKVAAWDEAHPSMSE